METEDVAREAFEWFETGTRPDGETFDRLKYDAPEWIRDAVYDAHGGMLPDDWRYACIRSAFESIADGETDAGEFADGEVDTYTGSRFEWLSSTLSRQGYVDEAVDEFGAESVYADGVAGAIGMGQYMEACEVFAAVLEACEDEADSRDETDEEEEEE